MPYKPILPLASGLIYNARTRAGITQAELARRLKVSPSAVSEWESGKKDPSVSNMYRIVSACGLSLRMMAADVTPEERVQRNTDAKVLLGSDANKGPQRDEVREMLNALSIRCGRAS